MTRHTNGGRDPSSGASRARQGIPYGKGGEPPSKTMEISWFKSLDVPIVGSETSI